MRRDSRLREWLWRPIGSLVVAVAAALGPSPAGAQPLPTWYRVSYEQVCAGGTTIEAIGVTVTVEVTGGACDHFFPGYVGKSLTISFWGEPHEPGDEFLGVSNLQVAPGKPLPTDCCNADDPSCCFTGYIASDDQGRVGFDNRAYPPAGSGFVYDGIRRVDIDAAPGWIGIGAMRFQLTAPCVDDGFDNDEDGLPDAWEGCGLNLASGGQSIEVCLRPPCDLNLRDMGADPFHKDLFVEIDWMRKGPHSRGHWARRVGLERMIDAFANAPVDNPDGFPGINIHIDAGPSSTMDPLTDRQWGRLSRSKSLPHRNKLGECGANINDACKATIWEDFDEIKAQNFELVRSPVFRYAVIAHQISDRGTSGLARGIPATNLIVSLGEWNPHGGGTHKQQGGTLMHELGHTLGLYHGGNENVNRKPNYLSVMNYFFQMGGLIRAGAPGFFDYSFISLPDLDEADLDEPVGLTGGDAGVATAILGYGTRYYCGGPPGRIAFDATGPIDWDCDGNDAELGVAQDINAGPEILLSGVGTNDWQNLSFIGGSIGVLASAGASAGSATGVELTFEEASAITSPFDVAVEGPEEKDLGVGESHVYEFQVTNIGENPDSYALQVTTAGLGVVVLEFPSPLALSAGESAVVAVPVATAENPAPGTQGEVRLRALSETSPGVQDEDSVLIEVVPEPSGNLPLAAALAALAWLSRTRSRPIRSRGFTAEVLLGQGQARSTGAIQRAGLG